MILNGGGSRIDANNRYALRISSKFNDISTNPFQGRNLILQTIITRHGGIPCVKKSWKYKQFFFRHLRIRLRAQCLHPNSPGQYVGLKIFWCKSKFTSTHNSYSVIDRYDNHILVLQQNFRPIGVSIAVAKCNTMEKY